MKNLTLTLAFLIYSFSGVAQVNFEQFTELKVALGKAFKELRPDVTHKLIINAKVGDFEHYWWDSESVHASYSQVDFPDRFEHNIFIFGGFARINGMTLDGLALTACHEIGHGIGGAPFKVTGNSSEGQSDYYATKTCLPIVFKYLKKSKLPSQGNYIFDLCSRSANINVELCLRALTAIESDIIFFESLGEKVSYSDFSTFRATELNDASRFYPDSQCRLDTMIHGVLQLERPWCWYPNGIERKL